VTARRLLIATGAAINMDLVTADARRAVAAARAR
jgi:hypothetical protein